MDGCERSTVPVRHGFPNPMFQRMSALIADVSQYRELAMLIKQQARKLGPNFKIEDLKANCGPIKEQLRALVEKNRSIPSTEPVMGSPPVTPQLYGRFGDGMEVVDVGSGKCMKIKRFSGALKFKAVDPNLDNLSGVVLKGYKMTLAAFLMEQPDPTVHVYSSWMTFPQLSQGEQEQLMDLDGIHLVPDHETLLAVGIATKQPDGKIKVKTGGREYVDNEVALDGYPITSGYLLGATFAEREIKVQLSEQEVQSKGPVPDPCAYPIGYYNLNFHDMTPKFDGTFCELDCVDGIAELNYRNGKSRVGVYDQDFNFCIHLEQMEGLWVLLRVVYYRGFVPPHWGTGLRGFCAKVKIKIDGKPVLPPVRWRPEDLGKDVQLAWVDEDQHYIATVPTDGVISRYEGKDHYCKYMWTVDLKSNVIPELRKKLQELGFSLDCEASWSGIMEMAMVRNDAVVVLKPLKPRVDKCNVTSLETILFLLDRPTLSETAALGEGPVLV